MLQSIWDHMALVLQTKSKLSVTHIHLKVSYVLLMDNTTHRRHSGDASPQCWPELRGAAYFCGGWILEYCHNCIAYVGRLCRLCPTLLAIVYLTSKSNLFLQNVLNFFFLQTRHYWNISKEKETYTFQWVIDNNVGFVCLIIIHSFALESSRKKSSMAIGKTTMWFINLKTTQQN